MEQLEDCTPQPVQLPLNYLPVNTQASYNMLQPQLQPQFFSPSLVPTMYPQMLMQQQMLQSNFLSSVPVASNPPSQPSSSSTSPSNNQPLNTQANVEQAQTTNSSNTSETNPTPANNTQTNQIQAASSINQTSQNQKNENQSSETNNQMKSLEPAIAIQLQALHTQLQPPSQAQVSLSPFLQTQALSQKPPSPNRNQLSQYPPPASTLLNTQAQSLFALTNLRQPQLLSTFTLSNSSPVVSPQISPQLTGISSAVNPLQSLFQPQVTLQPAQLSNAHPMTKRTNYSNIRSATQASPFAASTIPQASLNFLNRQLQSAKQKNEAAKITNRPPPSPFPPPQQRKKRPSRFDQKPNRSEPKQPGADRHSGTFNSKFNPY